MRYGTLTPHANDAASRRARASVRCAVAAGLACAALGLLVLAGWWLELTAVTAVVPGLPAMKANTALMFVLCGAAIVACARSASAWPVRLLAAGVFAIAGLSLLEHLIGSGLGLDELLADDPAGTNPGRPAPHTVVAFLLASATIVAYADARARSRLAATLLLCFLAVVLLAVVGYVYGVDHLRSVGGVTGMAPHTALGLLLLAVAIPALRPDLSPASWLLSDGEEGLLFRRLLPAAVLVPPLLGGLRLLTIGPAQGDVPFGVSVFAVSMVAVFTALVAGTARAVAQAGRRRHAAELELRASETRFRAISTLAPTGIQELSLGADCISVNPRWEQITGRSGAAARGAGWRETIHPEDREAVLSGLAAVARGGAELQLDHRIVRADGSVAWVTARAAAVTGADGAPASLLRTITDVTARKQLERATTAHNAKLIGLLDHWPGNAILYAEDGTIDMLNQQSAEALGVDRDAAVGRCLYELVPEETAATLRARDQQVVREDELLQYESSFAERTYSVSKFALPAVPGQPARLAAIGVDITARIHAEHDRDAARADFRHAFAYAPAGMAVTTLEGRFTRVNAALCELTGLGADRLQSTDLVAIVHPDDAERLTEALRTLLADDLGVTSLDARLLDAAGEPRWVELRASAVHDDAGVPLHLLLQLLDVTDRRLHEQQLRVLAERDPLTGLANRRCFARELEQHTQRSARYGPEGAVIVLDLDNFKLVNDTRGHGAGDELLLLVAQALTGCLRESDTVARLGGDEFAVLLPRASQQEARKVAEKVVAAIREGVAAATADGSPPVTASLGLAFFDDRTRRADEALDAADVAMYAAKAAGGDRYAPAIRAPIPAASAGLDR